MSAAVPPAADGARCSVAVIGGGISGLVAAWALRQRGVHVAVLEASDRVGGSIATHRADGYVAELGPNSLFETPEIARLVDAVGLTGERLAADPAAKRRYVVRGRRLVALPSSPASALTTPVLSLGAKLRILAEPFVGAPAEADESVASFVRRRLGAEVLDGLVDAFIAGTCAGDPERLSARHALRAAAALEARHGSLIVGAVREARARRRAGTPGGRPPMVSFHGGLHALPTAVARALGDAVRLQTRVVGMRRVADGWSLALRTPRGDHALAADAVLFAGPAHAIGAMALPGRLAASLAPVAAVEHAPVATLALGFRRADVAHPLDGFGALAPAAERLQLLGVLFGSSIFAGRAPDGHVLLTCFLGGVRRPGPAAVPASELLPPVLAELRDLLGVSGAPTFVRHTAWGRAIPQYTVGYDAVTRAIAEAERDEPTLALAGQYRAGAAIGDCVRSGLAAAERLAAALAGGRAATAAYGAAASWPGVPRVPELAP